MPGRRSTIKSRSTDRALRREIGQLLWIGFHGTSASPHLLAFLKRVRPGGVILFGRNIVDTRQVRDLTDTIHRALPIMPFLALDQEGGRVNRLREVIGPTATGHSLARRSAPAAAVRRHAEATALALTSLGFNVNFAPVLDLSGPTAANGIGDRAYGAEPATVARLAREFARAHLRAGVIPVGKHFPGLGGARLDSHLALPVIRRTRMRLLTRDLLPYERLRAVLPMVMVGHATYPALQRRGSLPASLSAEIIGGLLRKRIGFRGLILTDDLEMGAINQSLHGGEQALAAFEAGNDGLMFCQSEERIVEAHEALLRALADGEITRSRLRSSLARVARVKRRFLLRRTPSRDAASGLVRARHLMELLAPGTVRGFDPTARA